MPQLRLIHTKPNPRISTSKRHKGSLHQTGLTMPETRLSSNTTWHDWENSRVRRAVPKPHSLHVPIQSLLQPTWCCLQVWKDEKVLSWWSCFGNLLSLPGRTWPLAVLTSRQDAGSSPSVLQLSSASCSYPWLQVVFSQSSQRHPPASKISHQIGFHPLPQSPGSATQPS